MFTGGGNDTFFGGLGIKIEMRHAGGDDAMSGDAGDARPAGQLVVFEIDGGEGQVHLQEALIKWASNSVVVTAVEDKNGFSGKWDVRAHAICANP